MHFSKNPSLKKKLNYYGFAYKFMIIILIYSKVSSGSIKGTAGAHKASAFANKT